MEDNQAHLASFALAPDLFFPWLNSSGSLGYVPPPQWNWLQPAGAFITPPLSYKPRTPAETRAALNYPGGCLLHSGLPNPGLRSAIKHYAERWARLELPVWVHLIAEHADELAAMVHACENLENVMALEIGLPPDRTPQDCLDLLDSAAGELPVIAHLPLERAGENWLADIQRHGAGALSLGAPRGVLPRASVEGKYLSGRLYGPSTFPMALAALRHAVRLDMPVIIASGVYSLQDGETLLKAGAWAVALDTVLWNPCSNIKTSD
jgi:dihydroorotate dehydrogenase (NAD+) catalytic subunit